MRYVELRRHTDNDGDALTPDGPCAAEEIGRDRLNPPYPTLVSTGAARATQMLKILRSAAGQEARARRAAMDAHIVQRGWEPVNARGWVVGFRIVASPSCVT